MFVECPDLKMFWGNVRSVISVVANKEIKVIPHLVMFGISRVRRRTCQLKGKKLNFLLDINSKWKWIDLDPPKFEDCLTQVKNVCLMDLKCRKYKSKGLITSLVVLGPPWWRRINRRTAGSPTAVLRGMRFWEGWNWFWEGVSLTF